MTISAAGQEELTPNKRWQADQISAPSSLQFARCAGRYEISGFECESEVVKQREKRIKLYAIVGFWVFAILAAVSERTEFLFSVVFVSALMVGVKATYNTRFYAMMEAKQRQGKMYYFPVAQLLALCLLAVIPGLIAWCATYFVGGFS